MSEIKRRAFIRTAGAAALAWPLGPGRGAAAARETEDAAGNPAVYGAGDPWIEVDLEAMAFNVGQIRRHTKRRPVLAVLKCNAYGHGLVGVARRLEKIPVQGLVVGKLAEGLALRRAGIRLPVLNLGPFGRADAETIVRENISQSVYTDAVLHLQEWGRKIGRKAGVHIEIDTGLGRVGVPYEGALPFLRQVAGLADVRIDGVFQSFSEEPDTDKVQLKRFLTVTDAALREGLSIGLRHAAASTAVFSYGEEFWLDAVRPGIALYGHYPTDEERRLKRMELRPALALKTKAAYVKNLKPGDSLSYFRKFVAAKPERVVTAALGYSDGIPQSLAGKASALVRGRKLPFIADVTANHSYLLATGHPEIADGDEITLVGKQDGAEITLAELAEAVGVSDYKILIGLNPALHRTYRDR
jgi:alanine racemase